MSDEDRLISPDKRGEDVDTTLRPPRPVIWPPC